MFKRFRYVSKVALHVRGPVILERLAASTRQAPRAAVAQAAVARKRRWQRGRARSAEEIRRGERIGGFSGLRIDYPRGRDLPYAARAGHGRRP